MNTKTNSTTTLKNLFAVMMVLVAATSTVSTALAESNYEPYSFVTLAGMSPGSGGLGGDGTGSAARFYYPSGVTVDSEGNIYVADTSNNTIRKITPSRVVRTLAGLAGSVGSADGTGCAARFAGPSGVAVDNAGYVYVADTFNHTIRKITPSGRVSTFAGSAGMPGSHDDTGTAARFNLPRDVAVDNSTGNVYVADSGNQTIRKITPSGVVTTFAGSAGMPGSANGTGIHASFYFPRGVKVDSEGNVYVADTNNHMIRKITPSRVVSTFAGSAGQQGSNNGTGIHARFNRPRGVAVDSDGNVYVADSDNQMIRKITPSRVVSYLAGSVGQQGSADGTGSDARFNFPLGLAVDNAGNVYVADQYNYTIRKITASGVVSTFAGLAGTGSADGTGSDARFNFPWSAAVDNSTGNLYVADTNNHTIRKITPSGVVSTFAGSAGSYGSADGTGNAARFNFPRGVAVDNSTGTLYVADTGNNTIRMITPSGIVSTFAGSASSPPGSHDDNGNAASFHSPYGVAVDSAGTGNVYVADSFNHTIRKITPSRDVSTFAGLAGYHNSDDGNGNAARFFHPRSVAVDSAGNVYVADTDNHTIRKITPSRDVSTFAGSAGSIGSDDGTGTAARFDTPQGVAVDSADNIYVADSFNSTIRRITTSQVVSTLAGLPGATGSDDGIGSDARFYYPSGVAVDGAGSVYVADQYNNTVRLGMEAPPGITTVQQVFVYQLETTGTTSFMVSNLPSGLSFDPQLSAIVGVPTVTGTFPVEITATYPDVTTHSPLTITVQSALEPVITSGTSATSRVGQPFSFQVYTKGGTPAARVSAIGLPPGLSLDPVTGLISGSPAASGSSLVTLTVTDGSSTATATLQLIFTADRALPVITSSTSAFLYPGQQFRYRITVTPTCDPGEVPAFNLIGEQLLPQGLTFDHQTGIISGMYMGESAGESASQSDTSDLDPLIGDEGVISPDRTIRPPLSTCQPFATLRGNGTIPLNFFLGGPTTDPATEVASFSATLNGSLDLDGVTTTVYFQYGLTTTYGLTTPPQTETGNAHLSISAEVSSLTANTVYHYRIVAHNARGTSYGRDKTFTTLSPMGPPVIITSPATLIASYSSTLNGAVDPHGMTTTIYFQYGTTTGYGSATPMLTRNGNIYRDIVANISSLTASTTYHFRIVATNNAGTVYGADRTFTTLSASGPPVVTTNPATNVTSSLATLNGSLDPHGFPTTVFFRFGTTTGYGQTTPMETQTGNTFRNIAANISGLSAHTTYHFRIVATNIRGTRLGSDRTFTTP